ncbi:MAG: GntR family transcriptional regulator [Pirellulales bacterium]|nr:GntR family transcriptional regulator [Pirellulales bacterium]
MHDNLSQKAYWHIHDKLTTGALQPGLRLSNRAVAKEVGISFTPVREALNRLVSEGLLEYREGLGVFVPQVSHRQLEELYEIREILECEVVARVCGKLPKETMGQLHRLQEEMQNIVEQVEHDGKIGPRGEQFRQLDATFHLTLIRATGNRQLLETVADLRRKCAIVAAGASGAIELVGHVFQMEPINSIRRTCHEHDRLLALLQDRGGEDEAKRLARNHIRAGRQLALSAFDRTYINSSRRVTRAEEAAS